MNTLVNLEIRPDLSNQPMCVQLVAHDPIVILMDSETLIRYGECLYLSEFLLCTYATLLISHMRDYYNTSECLSRLEIGAKCDKSTILPALL